jgi:hypothetical protein
MKVCSGGSGMSSDSSPSVISAVVEGHRVKIEIVIILGTR